jgi:hypothetical protein
MMVDESQWLSKARKKFGDGKGGQKHEERLGVAGTPEE